MHESLARLRDPRLDTVNMLCQLVLDIRRILVQPELPNHGKRSTYVAGGCRCDRCRAANTDFQRKRRANARAVPPGGSHGLSGYENYGCLCPICTEAKKKANAAYWPVRRERGRR